MSDASTRESRRLFGWIGRGKPDTQLARQRLQEGTPRPIRVEDLEAVDPDLSKAPGLEQWQELVLLYADRIPIVGAATRYYEESTKRVRFYLVNKDTDEAIDADANLSQAAQVIEILNAYRDELARAVGLRFLIGESRHTLDINDKELVTRGAGELYWKGAGYVVKNRKGKEEDLDDHLEAWRSYDPDRKWSDLATSSHKSMLDIMEAFVIAYAEERAVSIRLALNTGIVGISEDVFAVGGGDEDAVNSEGSSQGAQLEMRFSQMLAMTIRNPRDAASFVPPVLVTPSGQKVSDMISHVPIAAERDKRKIAERIDMLKEEYAVGTDLPADVAKGFLADMNHWNGAIVDESAYKNYLAPKIQSVVRDAFEAIAEALDIDVTGLSVGIDNSQLLSPKDKTQDAFKAHESRLISDDAARKHTGFTDDDKPSPEHPNTYEAPEPLFNQGSGDASGESDAASTTIAAAAKRTNLTKFNKEVTKARYKFEAELRGAVLEAAAELVNDDGIVASADALDSITAAADPGSTDPIERLAAKITSVVRRGQQGIGLAASRGLATRRATDWYERHEARLAAQADRAGVEGSRLIQNWLVSKQAKAIPGREAYGIARSIESTAAGGPASMSSRGEPTRARPRVILEDTDFLEMVREGGSAEPVYSWEHGSPPQPFAPHVDLEGETWTADEEREVLDNPNDFPPSAIFHPGDHDGCTCRYDIEFQEV